MLRVDEEVAARALESLDVTVEKVRVQVVRIVGEGDELATGQIPFTPRAKKVLELGLREALSLGDDYIGTEHLLLGLIREGNGAAMNVLQSLGVSSEALHAEVLRMRTDPPTSTDEQISRQKRGRRALEVAVGWVIAARELAIATQQFHRASQLSDVEARLNALLGDDQ